MRRVGFGRILQHTKNLLLSARKEFSFDAVRNSLDEMEHSMADNNETDYDTIDLEFSPMAFEDIIEKPTLEEIQTKADLSAKKYLDCTSSVKSINALIDSQGIGNTDQYLQDLLRSALNHDSLNLYTVTSILHGTELSYYTTTDSDELCSIALQYLNNNVDEFMSTIIDKERYHYVISLFNFIKVTLKTKKRSIRPEKMNGELASSLIERILWYLQDSNYMKHLSHSSLFDIMSVLCDLNISQKLIPSASKFVKKCLEHMVPISYSQLAMLRLMIISSYFKVMSNDELKTLEGRFLNQVYSHYNPITVSEISSEELIFVISSLDRLDETYPQASNEVFKVLKGKIWLHYTNFKAILVEALNKLQNTTMPLILITNEIILFSQSMHMLDMSEVSKIQQVMMRGLQFYKYHRFLFNDNQIAMKFSNALVDILLNQDRTEVNIYNVGLLIHSCIFSGFDSNEIMCRIADKISNDYDYYTRYVNDTLLKRLTGIAARLLETEISIEHPLFIQIFETVCQNQDIQIGKTTKNKNPVFAYWTASQAYALYILKTGCSPAEVPTAFKNLIEVGRERFKQFIQNKEELRKDYLIRVYDFYQILLRFGYFDGHSDRRQIEKFTERLGKLVQKSKMPASLTKHQTTRVGLVKKMKFRKELKENLDSLGVKYEENKNMGLMEVDFFLPDHNIAVIVLNMSIDIKENTLNLKQSMNVRIGFIKRGGHRVALVEGAQEPTFDNIVLLTNQSDTI